MSKKLSNAPVYYTVVQALFNPIAAMATYANAIQEQLRLEGFTLFDQQTTTQLHFENSSSIKANIMEVPIWRFTKSNRTSGFILSQSYLTYHTTEYQTHDQFFETFLMGLEKIHLIVNLDHVSRLGLRYLNAVLPKENESIELYLNKGLHGVHIKAIPRYSLYESVFDTKTDSSALPSTLVNRVHTRLGTLGYPPDIIPPDLSPKPKFQTNPNSTHAVIDLDHFIEGQIPINIDQLKAKLSSLHKTITDAFYANITEHAKKVWE